LAAELRRLIGPYEILDLRDREKIVLKIKAWEQGTILIHPRYLGAPEEKEIPALRVHLKEGVKPLPPNYYDITSKTLQAQLLPMLADRGFEIYDYEITKYGEAPRARFTVARIPPPGVVR